MNDILIWGSDDVEYDAHLWKVLNRAREVNLQLNGDKCKTHVKGVAYVGHLLTGNGLKADSAKVKAITEMP